KSTAPSRWRRMARGCSTCTSLITRPRMWVFRPPRTTSTSGSSGTLVRRIRLLVERAPGDLRRLLLGFLLGAAVAAAVGVAAKPHGGAELLAVVRPLLLHPVLGHADAAGRGQLLQAGLPVQAGTALRRLLQQRVEQPVHQGTRGV